MESWLAEEEPGATPRSMLCLERRAPDLLPEAEGSAHCLRDLLAP